MTLKDYLAIHYSPHSHRSYESIINRFKARHLNPTKLTYKEIVMYIGELRASGLHGKSVSNHLAAIKIYYRYLQASAQRSDHPCEHLQLKDKLNRQIRHEQLYKYETLEVYYKNYEAKRSKDQLRNKLVLSLLLYQALRVGELIRLKTELLNLEKGTIKIASSHKGAGRILSLRATQVVLIQSYLQTNKDRMAKGAQLLVNEKGGALDSRLISKIINVGRSRYERVQAQRIRQSVIAYLLASSKDILEVQAFAGHKRSSTTAAYEQSELEELKLMIAKKHPLQ